MPRNGSGTYSPPAGTAAVSLQPIASVPYNNFLTDISSEMTNSLPTTGVKAMGANLPLGGNKIVNMGDGASLSDGATINNLTNFPGKVVAVQVLTTTGTYTKTAGSTHGDIYVVGGGGGGGGAAVTGAGQAAIGSGGAAGGLTIAYNVALSAFTGLTATIGAAGTVGAGATGGTGGTTTLGTLSATGGNGGAPTGAFSSAGSVFMAGGGSPGGGSGGTLNLVGHVGGIAFFLNTTPLSGSGAPSPLFGGGGVFSGSGTGGPGSGPGSGGGGAINGASAAAKAGALGAAGIIIIVERS